MSNEKNPERTWIDDCREYNDCSICPHGYSATGRYYRCRANNKNIPKTIEKISDDFEDAAQENTELKKQVEQIFIIDKQSKGD